MYGDIGVSASSLHRESTDSLIICACMHSLYGVTSLECHTKSEGEHILQLQIHLVSVYTLCVSGTVSSYFKIVLCSFH